ncbi:uncharacterized protein LOC142320016 [Lycorma delicatula]|uniref:uncharacterized protein LOC142320016 n=1 Tax=Lycorma delicatula TaxID=130591 RepID=UPI003F513AE4
MAPPKAPVLPEVGDGSAGMKQDGEYLQMDESQQLLAAPSLSNKGDISPRSQLSVTILDLAPSSDNEVSDNQNPQRRESANSVSDTYVPSSKYTILIVYKTIN